MQAYAPDLRERVLRAAGVAPAGVPGPPGQQPSSFDDFFSPLLATLLAEAVRSDLSPGL